jgi:lipopolysaccharide/colanic/teichoic acid biosynthesis glycosyltransferase
MNPPSLSGRLRSFFERILAGLLLVLFSPVLILSLILIRLTSSGPAIYRQVRSGKEGLGFVIFKLRSMYQNCEQTTGATWSKGHADPRVTPVGRILRASHLDELPQLWNIVLGDMSFVGPRPERPEILAGLSKEIEKIEDRVVVRPGLTGLAQIQQPSDLTTECFRKKLELDRVYIRHQSLMLDLRIILGTVLYLAGCSYSTVRFLMLLPSTRAAEFTVSNTAENSEKSELNTAVEVG